MPQKRVNYGRMYRKDSPRRHDDEAEESKTETIEESSFDLDAEPEVVEEPTRHRYRKTIPSKIRIRRGPGLNFKHDGEYVVDDEVVIVKVENGFGLLDEYKESGDGWVSLDYFKLVD